GHDGCPPTIERCGGRLAHRDAAKEPVEVTPPAAGAHHPVTCGNIEESHTIARGNRGCGEGRSRLARHIHHAEAVLVAWRTRPALDAFADIFATIDHDDDGCIRCRIGSTHVQVAES